MINNDSDFLALLSFCFPFSATGSNSLSTDELISRCKQLATSNPLQLEQRLNIDKDTSAINASQHALWKFNEKLYQYYQINTGFEASINQDLPNLLVIFFTEALRTPQWFIDDKHPLVTLLTQLQSITIGWQDDNSRASSQRKEQIISALHAFIEYWQTTDEISTNNPFSDWFHKQQEKSKKLERRLCDIEIGLVKAKRCQELSIKLLNDKMLDKQLPLELVEFLQGHWQQSIQLQLINSDNIPAEYQRLKKFTENFIWGFQPKNDDDEASSQRIYHFFDTLPELLKKELVSINHNQENLENILSKIEQQQLKVLKNQTLDYVSFSPLTQTNTLKDGKAKISRTLYKQVNQLNEGSWLIKKTSNNETQRLKLILKTKDPRELLFCDYKSTKQASMDIESFCYQFARQQFKTLNTNTTIKTLGNQILEKLSTHQSEKSRKLQLKQQALDKQLEQQRLQAKQKALEEAKRIEQLQAEQKQQREQENKRLLAEQKLAQINAEQELNRLKVGGIVIFSDNSRGKLAAKIQSRDKYIFVNDYGIKSHTLYHQQLIDELANKRITIHSLGNDFEDTLSKVVSDIRHNNQGD